MLRFYCFLLLFALFLSCQPPEWNIQRKSIIGGKQDSSYPAVGVLGWHTRLYFCSATLIAPRLVLTAAHCIDQFNKFDQTGVKAWFQIDVPNGERTDPKKFYAKEAFTHPDWDSENISNGKDLGVIVLTESVDITAPVRLYTDKMDTTWIGKSVFYLGYGVIETLPQRVSATTKYSTSIPISQVQSDRFTTYKKGTSVCSGDSGGPSLYLIDGEYHILGINSYVNGSADQRNQPNCDGTSTSMSLYPAKEWLDTLIAKHGGDCTQKSDCSECYTCSSGKCVHNCIVGGLCLPETPTSSPTCIRDPSIPRAFCGDGICNTGEDCNSCSEDCKCRDGFACTTLALCKPKSVCGDGVCDDTQGENCTSCEQDCNACPAVCGDGKCETTKEENCSSCKQDCSCKATEICTKNACIVPPIIENKTNNTPLPVALPCPLSEQSDQCDEKGQNCQKVCNPPVSKGCSVSPTSPPPFSFLLWLFVGYFFTRMKRKP